MFNRICNVQEFIIYLNGEVHTRTSDIALAIDTWIVLQDNAKVSDSLDFEANMK